MLNILETLLEIYFISRELMSIIKDKTMEILFKYFRSYD